MKNLLSTFLILKKLNIIILYLDPVEKIGMLQN